MRLFLALISIMCGWTTAAFLLVLWKMLDP